ncbi:MAG TPA: hypothetical protein VLE99_01205 [Candidatus Saccharimonadales bacterium]|nr:hypothetical protein [Candidatus Saccharimonadales bacterium]
MAVATIENDLVLPKGALWYEVVGPEGADSGTAPVIVCGEDVGGTDAILEVAFELAVQRRMRVMALLAGHGEQVFMRRAKEHCLTVTPSDDPGATKLPRAVILSPSVSARLERFLMRRYSGKVDITVDEDFAVACRRIIDFAIEQGLEMPTVCASDDIAKELLIGWFPGHDIPIEVTGSPTFDPLSKENPQEVYEAKRRRLCIPVGKIFVPILLPFLGDLDRDAIVQDIAGGLAMVNDPNVLFAIGPHQLDAQDPMANWWSFDSLDYMDASAYSSDDLVDAADLVIGGRSNITKRAAERLRDNITLLTPLLLGFTFPAVDAGVSVGARPEELAVVIPEVLEGRSERSRAAAAAREARRSKGDAARQVVDVALRNTIAVAA